MEAAAAAAAAAAEAEVAMGRDVPWDSCFLLGTRVYLFELEAKGEEARRATRIIRHAGAATTSNPSKATHVVVSDAAQPGSLKPLREHRDRVVFISWLDECERLGREADVEPHVAPTYMYVGGGGGGLRRARSGGGLNLSQEAASVDPVAAGKGKQSSRLRTTAADAEKDPPPPPPPRRRSSVPAAPNPLTRQALAKEAEAEAAAAEAAAASAARAAAGADQNRPPNANAGVGLSLDHATGTELPATAVAVPETNAVAVPVEGGGENGADALPFDGVRRRRAQLSPLQGGGGRRALAHPFRGRHRRLRASAGKLGEDFLGGGVRRVPRGAYGGGASLARRRSGGGATSTRHLSLAGDVRAAGFRDSPDGRGGSQPGVSPSDVRRARLVDAESSNQHVAVRRAGEGVGAHDLSSPRRQVHGPSRSNQKTRTSSCPRRKVPSTRRRWSRGYAW